MALTRFEKESTECLPTYPAGTCEVARNASELPYEFVVGNRPGRDFWWEYVHGSEYRCLDVHAQRVGFGRIAIDVFVGEPDCGQRRKVGESLDFTDVRVNWRGEEGRRYFIKVTTPEGSPEKAGFKLAIKVHTTAPTIEIHSRSPSHSLLGIALPGATQLRDSAEHQPSLLWVDFRSRGQHALE